MNYYDEILQELQELFEKNEFYDAHRIILNELNMPYIPSEIEDKLLKLKGDVEFELNNTLVRKFNEDDIEDYLKANPIKQLEAVNYLINQNIRNYIDVIKQYLQDNSKSKLAKALLIDALIRQEINDEIVAVIDGVDFIFIPRYIETFETSDGFTKADAYLQDYFANDEPSLYKMAYELLINEAYLYLPMVFEEDEAKAISDAISVYIIELMKDDIALNEFINQNNIKIDYLYQLKSLIIDI